MAAGSLMSFTDSKRNLGKRKNQLELVPIGSPEIEVIKLLGETSLKVVGGGR